MSKDKKLEKAGIYASFVRLLVKETGIKCDWKTKLSSDGNSVDFFYTFYIRNALTHQVKELPHCIPDVENSDLFEVSREIDETFREYKNKYMKNGISLKPCPFCGGEAAIDTVIKPDGGCHYEVKLVKCLKCGAKTKEKITGRLIFVKYCLVESNRDFIICHASGLSWSEAHLFLTSTMLYDGGKFQNVTMFELEANSPGLGVTCDYGGRKTTYYILDDPGRKDFDNKEATE